MKQYLPLKPVKRWFKVWTMADSLNGYLYDFDVHWSDRNTFGREDSAVVKESYHQLYYDNYFSSIGLLEKLLAQGTYAQYAPIARTSPARSVMKLRGYNMLCSHNAATLLPQLGRTTK